MYQDEPARHDQDVQFGESAASDPRVFGAERKGPVIPSCISTS